MELSSLRTFVPMDESYIGWNFRSLELSAPELSFSGTKVPWNVRPLELSFLGTKIPGEYVIISVLTEI